MDWDDGAAENKINLACPSSTRLITACEAAPAMKHPILLPMALIARTNAGPAISKFITITPLFFRSFQVFQFLTFLKDRMACLRLQNCSDTTQGN